MLKFIKNLFKKEKPLFNKDFKEFSKKVLEYNSSQKTEHTEKLYKALQFNIDPGEFVKSLNFENKTDLDNYSFSNLSKDAKTKIINIIKEDNKNSNND